MTQRADLFRKLRVRLQANPLPLASVVKRQRRSAYARSYFQDVTDQVRARFGLNVRFPVAGVSEDLEFRAHVLKTRWLRHTCVFRRKICSVGRSFERFSRFEF